MFTIHMYRMPWAGIASLSWSIWSLRPVPGAAILVTGDGVCMREQGRSRAVHD
jgi:hypothetical protein